MNIQDIDYANAKYLSEKCEDLPIILGFCQPETPKFDFSTKYPNEDDPRFVLPSLLPYHRKLLKVLENDEVIVGIFHVPENENRPYPLCAQYSTYYLDKKNPEKECGGGTIGSNHAFPPIHQRDKGIDRDDWVRIVDFINDVVIKKLNFTKTFEYGNLEEFHSYWPRPEIDRPNPKPIGEDFRGEDGVLRRLEALFEDDKVRVEISSLPERDTELCSPTKYGYCIDVFQDGKCISGNKLQSAVMWPPIRERKFGIDYNDWDRIQDAVKQTLDFLEIRTNFKYTDDKDKYVYLTTDHKKFDSIMVMKKK